MKRYHPSYTEGNWGKVRKRKTTQHSTAQNAHAHAHLAEYGLRKSNKIDKRFEDQKEQNSQQEQHIPQRENQLRELEQLLRQKEIQIQQDERQRRQQVNQLQETLCEVHTELQQQISRNSILIQQQAKRRRITISDLTPGVQWKLPVALGVSIWC